MPELEAQPIPFSDPTMEMREFLAVMNCMEKWRILPEASNGFCPDHGRHAMAILEALAKVREGR